MRARAGARIAGRLQAVLGLGWRAEMAGLAGIVALAAATRFVNLPGRGGWDADQAVEMAALRRAIEAGSLPTFGPEAISVGGSFHHGALYYDLLLPAAWLGGGDPTFVVAEIALLSLLVVPIVWWIARTMAGPAAGLIAALLAAVSAALIGYGTFIWNPTLVEPAAAVAFLGAWQAWRTARPRWWLVAAAGTAVAAHAHVAAAVLALPMAAVFVADLRRGVVGPEGSRNRRSIVAWGAAGVALVAATYAPLAAYELGPTPLRPATRSRASSSPPCASRPGR
jgi:4-amino-4-deoxy-L-arabinose transferase-like glycosyltransferase